jgi:hypothetical protein
MTQPGQSRLFRGQKGVVLLITFIMMTALTVLVFSFVYMTTVRTRASGYDLAAEKAFWLTEAGVQDVIYRLKTSATYRTTPTTVNANLGGGSYTVTVVKNGSTYTLTSTGTAGILNRRITQTVSGTGGNAPQIFSHAMHSFGNVDAKNVTNGTINGDTAAEGTVDTGPMTVHGTNISGAPQLGPYPVDYASYKAIANYVYTSDLKFASNTTYGSPSAKKIWYTTKDISFGTNVTIYGTIIAEGGISTKNSDNITISPAVGYPAVISGNTFEVKNSSNVTISGLIYSQSDISIWNATNITINGTMVASTDIVIKNDTNITITYDAGIMNSPPPFFTSYEMTGGVTPNKDWTETYIAS